MKFRKKPIIIEAEQWFPEKKIDGVITSTSCYETKYDCHPVIYTKEGMMNVSPGDWIITGVEGERYCCKDSIFKKTYERVNQEEKNKESKK